VPYFDLWPVIWPPLAAFLAGTRRHRGTGDGLVGPGSGLSSCSQAASINVPEICINYPILHIHATAVVCPSRRFSPFYDNGSVLWPQCGDGMSWCPGVLVSWACCLVRQTADTRTKGQPGRASTHTNNHFWWRPTKDSRPLLCPPGRTPAASPRVMITNGRSIIRFPADSPMDPIHRPEARTCPAGRTMALGVSLKCIFISLG